MKMSMDTQAPSSQLYEPISDEEPTLLMEASSEPDSKEEEDAILLTDTDVDALAKIAWRKKQPAFPTKKKHWLWTCDAKGANVLFRPKYGMYDVMYAVNTVPQEGKAMWGYAQFKRGKRKAYLQRMYNPKIRWLPLCAHRQSMIKFVKAHGSTITSCPPKPKVLNE